jgi:hypothetical protein
MPAFQPAPCPSHSFLCLARLFHALHLTACRYSFVTATLKYPIECVVVCGESIGSVASVHIAQAKPVRR